MKSNLGSSLNSKIKNTPIKYLREDVVKYNLELYLKFYPNLIKALDLNLSEPSREQFASIVIKSVKESLFYKTLYSMLPKLIESDNLVNEILKLSIKQQRTLYIAHHLDKEVEKNFSIKDKDQEILKQENIQQYNQSLILLMNLVKEYLAPLEYYSKLYNNFIKTIRDKLSIIESVKESVKNKNIKSIFKSISLENRGDAELIIDYFLSGGDINIKKFLQRFFIKYSCISRKLYCG